MAAAFDGGHAEDSSLAKLVPSVTHGGRAVVAACDLTAGTVVLRALPAAYAVHDHLRQRRCAVCLRKSSSKVELQRCVQCRRMHYCSKRCQLVDWKRGHKAECRHLQGMGEGKAAEDSLLAVRCLRLLKQHSKLDESKPDSACVLSPSTKEKLLPPPATPYEHTWPDIAAMCAVEPSSQLAQPAAKSAQADFVVHILRTGVAPQRSAPIIGDLLQQFPANNFSITDDLVVSQAAGVYPLGALLNHSCVPNCIVTYEEETHVQEMRTVRAVPAGEELTHSFVNLALPARQRQEHLQAVYGFTCACPRCSTTPALPADSHVRLPPGAVPVDVWGAELASSAALRAVGAEMRAELAETGEATGSALSDIDTALQAAAESPDEQTEVRALQAALRNACGVLHPLHSKLGELHSALQQVHMVTGDMAAAAQHAAFLAVQNRFALSACGSDASAGVPHGGNAGPQTVKDISFGRFEDISPPLSQRALTPHPLMALQVGALLELLHAAQPAEDSIQWTFDVPAGGEWMRECLPTSIRKLFDLNADVMQVVYGWRMLRRPTSTGESKQ